MMLPKFPYASVWQYLNEKGVLENGTHEELQRHKKEYWRQYKKHYQRTYRKSLREVAVRFTHNEYKELGLMASALGVSVPSYVRTAALVDATEFKKTNDATKQNRLNLSLIQTEIENLIRSHIERGSDLESLYKELLKRLEDIESRV